MDSFGAGEVRGVLAAPSADGPAVPGARHEGAGQVPAGQVPARQPASDPPVVDTLPAGVRRSALVRMLSTTRRLGACTDLAETLDQIAQGVVDTLEFVAAVISVVTPRGDLRADAAVGPPTVTQIRGLVTSRRLWDSLMEKGTSQGSLFSLGPPASTELVEAMSVPARTDGSGTSLGGWRPDHVLLAPLLAHDGTLLGVLSVDSRRRGQPPDVEQRTLLELFAAEAALAIVDALRRASLADRELLFHTVFDGAPAPMAVVDARGLVLHVNDAMSALVQMPAAALAGRQILDFVDPDDRDEAAGAGRAALAGAGQAAVEHRLGRPVGSQRWVHSTVTRIDTPNSGVRLIVKLEDITERREALEELRYLADHDPLTGLPNRRFALERLASLLKARSARTVTVLFCDLDGFKAVNDHLGHRAGDELLVHVARRLDSVIRPGELLCRLGGDEFVIISSLADPLSSAPVIAERCISALADPFSVAGNRVAISMSVGIASSAGDETDAATLIAGADTALYGAKGQGGGGWGWRSAPSRSTGDRAATPPGPA